MKTKFEKHILPNGLKVIVHKEVNTAVATLNLLYNVGSRDEDENKTGFAHLFEHLMFGGSVNIPDFDKPLQFAGGTSNAFTNTDITNYYETIPVQNLETLFWLESDRMQSLAFTDKSLEVQRNVVIEEFRQRYINQPYGDLMHLLRSEAYKVHPYRWPTIGLKTEHISNATMEDVRGFFFKHYNPDNAILCVTGNVNPNEVFKRAEHWFGGIGRKTEYVRNLPVEPLKTKAAHLEVTRKVPEDMLLMTFPICKRTDADYPATDLISDLLGRSKSARLHRKLVMEHNVFSEIGCYVTGELDNGLLMVNGTPADGVPLDKAAGYVKIVLDEIKNDCVKPEELEKVKNKYLSAKFFDDAEAMSKALNLCYYELLGNAEMMNTEPEKFRAVTPEDIRRVAQNVFKEEQSTTIFYKSENK